MEQAGASTRQRTGHGVRRRGGRSTRAVCSALAAVLLMTVLAGCNPARVGGRCSGGYARDNSHVLACKNGRWARLMTFGQYLQLTRPGGAAAGTIDGVVDVAQAGLYNVRFAGWIRDNDVDGPIAVRIADGFETISETGAVSPRPDVPGRAAWGFDVRLTLDAGYHNLCVTAVNAPGTPGSDRFLQCFGLTVETDAPADPLPAGAGWLDTLNHHRAGSGLPALLEEPSWNDPIMKHLIYLRDTPKEYFTGPYENLHRENPASPYYTPEGAGYSHNVLTWAGSERGAIDSWMTAPFHALLLLESDANRAGFAKLEDAAAAKVSAVAPYPGGATTPVMFPGNGAVTSLRRFGGESPDPLESCPGYRSAGLPIIVTLPYDPPPGGVSASLTLPTGTVVPSADLCVVTEDNYQTTDAIYGATGRGILDSYNSILVIPRKALSAGTHNVSVRIAGHPDIDWSFVVAR